MSVILIHMNFLDNFGSGARKMHTHTYVQYNFNSLVKKRKPEGVQNVEMFETREKMKESFCK